MTEKVAREFFNDVCVVGKKMEVQGDMYTIVGVVADYSTLTQQGVEMWLPYPFNKFVPDQTGCYRIGVLVAGSVDEMKKITSIRCLAMLPRIHVKARTEKKEARMTLCNPSLPHRYKESIRLLKNRAEKAMKQHGGRVYLITSTSSGEGKSLTSVNFAMQLAMDGARVLLIDGDLRKQGDGSLLNVTSRCGLTEVIKAPSEEELWNRVQKNSQLLKVKNLYFIGNSRRSQQTAALLSSDKVKRTFRTLLKFVDYIVIDSPPVGMFQDAALLAEYADGILYLVGYDQLSAGSVREGIQTLSGRRVPFLGYAFNNCPDNGRTYGYGRYGYGKYGYGKYGYGGYGAPAENTEAE